MPRRNSFPQFNSHGNRPRRRHRGGRNRYGHRDIYASTNGAFQEQAESTGWIARGGRWFHALQNLIEELVARPRGGMESDGMVIGGAGLGLGALLNGMDWENVRTDVERENRAHVILVGAEDAGKTTLVYRLKGLAQETITPFDFKDAEESATDSESAQTVKTKNFGFFGVLDLQPSKPPGALSNGYLESDGVWNEIEAADLIVWVLDCAQGLRAWEYEWISRVRGSDKPLIVAANKSDQMNGAKALARWEQALGVAIIPISAREGTNVMTQLVPRMADAIPSLATALGREVVEWRRTAAARVMRRAATLSGLIGLEPVPLLDLPFQISIQLQMVLRLAAIYGQPLRDQYSREMLATMVSAVGIRFAGAQLVKAIPLLGWIISGAVAAGGTWLIGRIALGYFEHGRRVSIPLLRRNETRVENTETEIEEHRENPTDVSEHKPSLRDKLQGLFRRIKLRRKITQEIGGNDERETL